jgi:GNAT superfamily N-acetyltransferase
MSTLAEDYELVTDQSAIDPVAAHAYLTTSYWSRGIPLETVQRALAGSLCVAVRHAGAQIAFARVVTDRATFAYLADVYVLDAHRGQGLSKAMVAALHAHPELQGLRRWMLMTRDAHGLYAQFGWTPLADPALAMERHDPQVYA